MGIIALLIVGAAIIPLEPQLLGCRYGEDLSAKPMSLLGDWDPKNAQHVWLCADGPGRLHAYEDFEVVCEKAQIAALPARSECIAPPPSWKPEAPRK